MEVGAPKRVRSTKLLAGHVLVASIWPPHGLTREAKRLPLHSAAVSSGCSFS